ncbi:MAG TPA: alpha-hydroxy-acid oxidizing protein [Verrucomicrobiae bacterium]|jgi:isopentenyl diphosphate isomerase/L-lactate dehydrogenase-like FMN-dependent dehydrogenase|nr:alpha-hydroxy-acid oxidizing protein [Verrucomicrobiae bacterium]
MSEKSPISPIPSGMQRQQQVYTLGLTGGALSVPVSLSLLEQKAKDVLSAPAFDYVAGGAGGESTIRANGEAFYRWRIVPRMLRDVSKRDLSVELFGEQLPAPVILGPVGVQGILHAEGELASARAAAALGLPFTLSTAASRSIEEVARAVGSAGKGAHWFQLYWGKNPDLTASMLQRAERAGYKALVVTLDTGMLAWRERDLQHAYLPFILGQGLGNYFSDPVFRALLPEPPEQNPAAAIQVWSSLFSNTTLTWRDIPFLRKHTALPILLKGILHPDDANHAMDAGVDGVIVSNHGGRQVDGAIATLEALPAVVREVNGRIPVLFDGGVRRGADVFKALALGARAVLLGRLYTWGLAVAGEQGVRDVVLNLVADLDLTMALSGHTSCRALDSSALCDSR